MDPGIASIITALISAAGAIIVALISRTARQKESPPGTTTKPPFWERGPYRQLIASHMRDINDLSYAQLFVAWLACAVAGFLFHYFFPALGRGGALFASAVVFVSLAVNIREWSDR